jgi:hypothetical protein
VATNVFVDPNTIDNPTTNGIAPAAWGDVLRDNQVGFAQDFPRLRVHKSATQAITTATDTAVTWNVDDYDNDTMHDVVSNTSRLIATHAGKYRLTAFIQWADSTGQRYVLVKINGTATVQAGSSVDAANFAGLPVMHSITWEGEMAAADYAEIYVYQNTGGNLNVATTSWACLSWTGVHS